MKYWTKKTVTVTKNGKTTTTVEETNKPPKNQDILTKKFEKIMDKFSELMEEL